MDTRLSTTVKNGTLVAAFYGTVAICVLVALEAARTGRVSIVVILVVNLVLAMMFTRIVGPFILTPLAISCILVGLTSIRRINARLWLLIAWTCVAVLLPIVLEWVGALPRTWQIKEGATVITSSAFESHGTSPETAALAVANLVFTLVVGGIGYAFSRKRQETQRKLFIREWHLRQLIPQNEAAPGKRPWATRLNQRVMSK